MSFTIYKTFPKTLKFTSAYSHYSLGAVTEIDFIYVENTGYLHYHATADAEPNGLTTISGFTAIDNFYELSTTNVFSLAYSSSNNLSGVDTSQEFYVANETDKLELTEANQNAPTSLVVQEIYPSSKDYNLLDGSFVTYKSNTKHKIVLGFEYLPKTTLDEFISLSKTTVILVPEKETSNVDTVVSGTNYKIMDLGDLPQTGDPSWQSIGFEDSTAAVGRTFLADNPGPTGKTGLVSTNVSPFENKAYVCNWQGSNLNFEYANPYKKAGYKGQISFLEV